jgi:hypothetical protein
MTDQGMSRILSCRACCRQVDNREQRRLSPSPGISRHIAVSIYATTGVDRFAPIYARLDWIRRIGCCVVLIDMRLPTDGPLVMAFE